MHGAQCGAVLQPCRQESHTLHGTMLRRTCVTTGYILHWSPGVPMKNLLSDSWQEVEHSSFTFWLKFRPRYDQFYLHLVLLAVASSWISPCRGFPHILLHGYGYQHHYIQLTRKYHPKWWNCTSDRESDGRNSIEKPGFLFEFPSNHTSVSLSFGDNSMWQTDGQCRPLL